MKLLEGVRGSAEFSRDLKLRYVLTRVWDESKPALVIVGLNPSDASATVDDMTIRKGIGFAKRDDKGSLVMLNLFPQISTDPRGLLERDPLRDGEADAYTRRADELLGRRVIYAWGGSVTGIDVELRINVCELTIAGPKFCLGFTADGAPRHPSRLAYATPLVPYVRGGPR